MSKRAKSKKLSTLEAFIEKCQLAEDALKAPPEPYDPRVLQALQPRWDRQNRRNSAARFEIYRDVFPWFGQAMKDAGYTTSPNGNDATQQVLMKANAAWIELTGLPILNGPEGSWEAAGVAAGFTAANIGSIRFTDLVATIKAWAIAKRAHITGGEKPAKELLCQTQEYITLTDPERAVMDEILKGVPLSGKALITQVGIPDLSTLTCRIIPRLKKLFGVENRRGVGYFLDWDAWQKRALKTL